MLCLAVSAAACRPESQSPLVRAAVLGQTGEVARLLAGGADPRERTSRGFTALGLAAREGQVEVIEQLVKAGADPNLRDANENEWTPLLNAVHKHQRQAVTTLLRLGAEAPPEERRALHGLVRDRRAQTRLAPRPVPPRR